MTLILDVKDAQQLTREMEEYLTSETSITYTGDGSIARSILETVNEKIEEYYEEFDFNLAMAFVSTAEGSFLDLIGELLDCERQTGEDDENYRYRITNQVYVVAGANRTAIRLSCLSVDNVKDIVISEFSRGPGSFSVYVDVDDYTTENSTINDVQSKIDEVKAQGVYGEALIPLKTIIDMNVKLVFESGTDNKGPIIGDARQAIIDYIHNLDIAEDLHAASLISEIMDTDDSIRDVQIESFFVDDVATSFATKEALWNEKMIPGDIEVS